MTPTTEAFEALMPEPVAYRDRYDHSDLYLRPGIDREPLHTADQLRTAMQAVWDAATERAAKQERETEARLVWAMNHMGLDATHADFCSHVLRRGGTGDYGDCTSFIDAAIRASGGKGAA